MDSNTLRDFNEMTALERVSIELTNQCGKACSFCYNHSLPEGSTDWQPSEVIDFVRDCAKNGVKAVSFGGGEPLQYPGLFDLLAELHGTLFRSITTNGLLLSREMLQRLCAVSPDKIHVSIHFPERRQEVTRVIEQVHALSNAGIQSGINFLVDRNKLDVGKQAAQQVRDSGIGNERIVYLPMRGQATPTPEQVADVAGNQPFQSMSCLSNCARSPRFCSIGWDKSIARCSYTSSRVKLPTLTYEGIISTLPTLDLTFCGGLDD